ncbi:MAG: acyl-CoA dehydrogenase family protein [Firmicutes bacterium]|nr:acyl-CoA dehydrogenase family protein [Dethiobacter sp.]MBS3898385.1 acyl-CoA dehydrogenase family protein [Dethiobacter sp.]MCL4462472.1 acyl-CoA dehydrogenase family protein [Bacillota bacterium]MCL5993646.1 acyl-CoA dehydrogenase family protein [Bacillota bacterium]
MLSFKLSTEEDSLRSLAREFAKRELLPVAAEYDRSGDVPWPVIKKAWEVGFLNMGVPEEYGGGGQGILSGCLVSEELAAACAGISATLALTDLACTPIILAGTAEQKERWLRPVCREMKMVAFCVTEPEAGSDVAALTTTARRDGDSYILNGSKQFITNASIADYFIVFATTDKKKGHKGLSAFVVERTAPGLAVGKKEDKMGQRASDTASVSFSDVVVAAANRLGAEGDGFRLIMQTFNRSRPGVAAAAVGLGRSAMEHALQYAKTRVQFGVPIILHQSISFMLADMQKDLDAARLLAWRAAWLADAGEKNSREAAMAKAFAADVAMRVTTEAVQIFGGYGYSREYPVEKLMRDAKVMQIYEGTAQIQRLLIAKTFFEN